MTSSSAEDQGQPPLGRNTVLGTILLVGARLLSRIMDLGLMMVLVRLFDPSYFGLVAIAVSVVAVVEAALELPIHQALVRIPTITNPQYDTAFTLSLLRALLLTALLGMAAWPISHIYDDGRLAPLICFLSVGAAFRGLISPRLAGFHQQLSFWRDFLVEITGKTASSLLVLLVAFYFRSYWSIATVSVFSTAAMSIASFIFAPHRIRLSLSEFSLFNDYVGWNSAAQIVLAFNWQFERLMLGKMQSASTLGLFTTSNDLANIPFLSLLGPVNQPLVSAFSRLENDHNRRRTSYKMALEGIIALGLPVLVGQIILADSIVRIILGDRWMDTIPLVQWLSFSLIPALFSVPAHSLTMAYGRTKIVFLQSVVNFCVKTPVLIVGLIQYGVPGIIFARMLSEVVITGLRLTVVKKLIAFSVIGQIYACWRSVASVCVMAALTVPLSQYFEVPASVQSAITKISLVGLFGTVVYCTVTFVLWQLSGRIHGPETIVAKYFEDCVRKVFSRR